MFSEGKVESLWTETSPAPHFGVLSGDKTVDVAIIGAGMTGLTAAHELKKHGLSVAVLEKFRVATGESSHTTAHLTECLDLAYTDLISRFGVEKARLVVESKRKALKRIEDNILEHQIDCSYTHLPGYLYSETLADRDKLYQEVEAAQFLGVTAHITDEIPLPFPSPIGIRFENQAQFHPRDYLIGLAQKIAGEDCKIFEQTRVIGVVEGDPCLVYTDRGVVHSKHVIVAANVPVINKFFLHTKLAAYRSYAIAARVKELDGVNGLFWDTNDPYHFIRTHRQGEVGYLIVGGEDHKTGQLEHPAQCFEKLERFTHSRFTVEEVAYRWSGQIIEPVDGLPFIGKNTWSEKVYVATGFSGNGMTFGTLAGMLLGDLITGKKNPWFEIYSATRIKPIASAKQYFVENVDYPNCYVTGRLASAETDSMEDVRPGEGKIVNQAGRKLAVFKDARGELHILSPVCPHLGCHVGWNDAEKSWDCPCHGSRFDPYGQVLNGPAMSDLVVLEKEKGPLFTDPIPKDDRWAGIEPPGLFSF